MTETLKGQISQEEQFVVFTLADEPYGVDVSQVRDITMVSKIAVVQGMPDFVEGTIDLRGQIVAIVDLRKRFGLPERKKTKETKIIVTDRAGIPIGMVIDQVIEVMRLSVNSIEDLPDLVSDVTTDLIKAVGKLKDGTLLIIVDLEQVLSSEEMEKISKMVDKQSSDE